MELLRKTTICLNVVLVLALAGSAGASLAWNFPTVGNGGTFTSDTSFPPMPIPPAGLGQITFGPGYPSATQTADRPVTTTGSLDDLFDDLGDSYKVTYENDIHGGDFCLVTITIDLGADYSVGGIYYDGQYIAGRQDEFREHYRYQLYDGANLVWEAVSATRVGPSQTVDSGGFLVPDSPVTADKAVVEFRFFEDWVEATSAEHYEVAFFTPEVTRAVAVDIKPGSCPNPFNLASKGVTPVAILGTEDFDVNDIDPASVELAGVGAIRSACEDVATPVMDGNECDCSWEGPDGYMDLTLKFKTQQLVTAIVDLAEPGAE
ncbi:MAG: hypothetical protein ACYS4W_15200, partial [Planctomycetota bacterium]